jgi:hypothetical protein
VKKKEHPRTWLWMNPSEFFSFPNSSSGSAQRMSHMRPCVGGSLNLLTCVPSPRQRGEKGVQKRDVPFVGRLGCSTRD